jgi:hypothetical protein
MTTATDEFVQLTQRSQEAVTTAVRSWTGTLQSYAGSITPTNPLPATADTVAVVESWFDLATTVLAEQRALTTAAVTRAHDAVSALTEQAGAVTATVTEKIASVTPAATEADKPRGARNGATRTA